MSQEAIEQYEAQQRFKLLVEQQGRTFCYVDIFEEGRGWAVAQAVQDERGYFSTDIGPYATELEARKVADAMNDGLGVDKKAAMQIVTSSMRLGRGRK